jgi:hypothetical protein
MKSYYLPLDYRNIAFFFSDGVIKPISLYSEGVERTPDIQSSVKNALLISENQWIEGCTASIELVLTKTEISYLEGNLKGWFLCRYFLPISRIKAIYLTGDTKGSFLYKATRGTAYIPERLVHVDASPNYTNLPTGISLESSGLDNSEFKKLVYFERLLGGITLMKSISFYENNYADFLSYIQNIHNVFSQEVSFIESKSNILGKSEVSKDRYEGLFKPDGEFANLKPKISEEKVTISDIEKLLRKEFKKSRISNKVQNLSELADSEGLETYLMVILAEYKGESNHTTLFQELSQGKLPYKQVVALIYGLHNKYSAFRNSYRVADVTEDFVVKFKLESQLDYYLIESAYLKALFPNEEIKDFSYLATCLPPVRPVPESEEHDYIMLFDEVVMVKKKTVFLSKDYSEELLSTYSESLKAVWIDALNSGFAKPFKKWFMNIAEQLRQDSNKHKESYESKLNRLHAEEESKLTGRISELEGENLKLKEEVEACKADIYQLEKTLEKSQKISTEKEEILSENNQETSAKPKLENETSVFKDKIAIELGEEKGVVQEEPTEESKADDKVLAMSVEKEDTVDGVKENKKEEKAVDQEDKTPVLDDHKQSFEKEPLSIEKDITNDKTDDEVEDLKNPEHKASKPSVPKKRSRTAKKTKAKNENKSGDIFKKE